MAEFRTRRIRQKPPLKPFKKIKSGLLCCSRFLSSTTKRQRSYVLGSIAIIIAVLIVFRVTTAVYNAIRDFNPKEVIFALGTDLKQDENGYTNIVLMGDGGHERDGADLIDTIMVASIDFEDKSVSLLSIPRDFYVKDEKYGSAKINEFYRDNKKKLGEDETYAIYQELAGNIANLEIQYYARVDFNAFVEVVDALGGITVDVKEAIYDPYYPNETDDGFTVFEISAGPHEMDGETALKFVRSRKTTSDFDRAARQQQVLMAIRDKALSSNILTSAKTIKKLYSSISENLNTNLTLREMIAMASFGKDFDTSRLVSKVIHDDPSRDGGFLYTPERKYYNGQFVLVPNGDNLDLIHKYAELIFHKRDVLMNPAKVEILNATKNSGIAGIEASYLTRFGFDIVSIDNLYDKAGKRKNVDKSFIRYNSWEADADGNVLAHHKSTLDALAGFVKGDTIPNEVPETDPAVDITIVLGADYTD